MKTGRPDLGERFTKQLRHWHPKVVKGKVRVPAVSGGKARDKAGKAAGTSARMAAGTGPAETNGTPETGAAETGTIATAGAAGQAISQH